MTKNRLSVAAVALLALCAPLRPGRAQELRLAVRVFIIPSTQQFESAVPDGRGGTADLQVFGNVTSLFPRAIVLFPSELAATASDDAVGAAVRERVVFGSGGLVASKGVSVRELKSLELLLGPDQPSAEGRFEESRGEGRSSDYRVTAELLSADQAKSVIRLRFDAGWHAVGGRLGVGMSNSVISVPVEVRDSRLTFIGGQAEGTVYWLAVAALPGR